jgi:drug/metabolite transporter (DMT)-like permease
VSLTLIVLGVVIMTCAAIIETMVRRRRRRFFWALIFLVGCVVVARGIRGHAQDPQAAAGGTSQHSKADRLDLPVFTPRTEVRT